MSAVPLPPAFDADALARRTVEALQAGDLALALETSQYFAARFPHTRESMLLHAVILSQAAEATPRSDLVDAALQAWDRVLRRNPQQPEYLAQALRLAWRTQQTAVARGWTDLLRNLFLCPPPVALLAELEARGTAVTGSVGIHDGALRGWSWQPVDDLPRIVATPLSARPPDLHLADMQRLKTETRALNIFSIPLPPCAGMYSVAVGDASGCPIHGSPVVVASPTLASPAHVRARAAAVAVVIPVYADREASLTCIGRVLASRKANRTAFDIVAVWDHGPDPSLLRDLQRLAARRCLVLHTPPHNLGFLGAVNLALEQHPGQAVVLLNADTLVHGDWLDRLHRIGSRPGVGTVTPFGTHAELMSFPAPQIKVAVTRPDQVRRLDDACRLANAASRNSADTPHQPIPVGVGFCMYIPRAARARLGGLDGRMLCRGYGEEVEFCLRARALGLRNMAACNVFVGHVGERSFGAGKLALAAQNNVAIFTRYPDYKPEYDTFAAVDPLRPFRERATRLLLSSLTARTASAEVAPAAEVAPLHVAHTLDGALPELLYLADTPAAILLFQPCGDRVRAMLRLRRGLPLPDLHFVLPRDMAALSRILTRLAPSAVVSHSSGPLTGDMLERLGLPALPVPSCPAPPEALPVMRPDGPPGRWLVPAPRTLSAWQRLCALARHTQSGGHVFKVLHLEASWKYAPRPLNVWPAPETDTLALTADGLLLFDAAAFTPHWQRWCDDMGLTAFVLAPQTKENA